MRKILSFFLILSLVLAMAGCGNDAAVSNAVPAAPSQQLPEQAPEAPEESGQPQADKTGGDAQETPAETPQPQPQQPSVGELNFASSYEEIYRVLEKLSQTDEEELQYGVVRDYFAPDKNEAVEEAVPEAPASEGSEYSGTNVQVSGIDEGDIVKTDGEYIYILSRGEQYRLVILKADGEASEPVSTTELGYISLSATPAGDLRAYTKAERYASELFISGDILAVIYEMQSWSENQSSYGGWNYDSENRTEIEFYDISDPAKPRCVTTLGQDGSILGTRLYDGRLYVVSSWSDHSGMLRDQVRELEELIPALYADQERYVLEAGDICICTESGGSEYVVAAAYDMAAAQALGAQSILGGGNMIYMSRDNIYVAGRYWSSGQGEPRKEDVYTVQDYRPSTDTRIYRFSITEKGPELSASATVPGYLESRFSMDEHEGFLRLVTTVTHEGYTVYIDEEKGFVNFDWFEDAGETNSLYILDGELQLVGSVEDLAEGERVYSARFDGEMAYFCTFEQVDPLFAVDCSDPSSPVVLSALKISGFSEYLHSWGENLLFGFGYEADESTGWVEGLKMVMFNTSDKADVTVENSLHLEDVTWSEALYEPHAFFIAPEKNIIGFVGDGDYYIYGYSAEEGFYQRARFDFHGWEYNARGLYIGDEIYLIGQDGGYVLDLESCEIIKNLYW